MITVGLENIPLSKREVNRPTSSVNSPYLSFST